MKGFTLFDGAALAEAVEQARKDAGGQFQAAFLQAVRDQLRTRPAMYRSFGPYWWPLKREMIRAGIHDFGLSYDAETADALSYGDAETTLAACALYQGYVLDNLSIYEHDHAVGMADGTIETYTLTDDDMEAMEVGRLISQGTTRMQ